MGPASLCDGPSMELKSHIVKNNCAKIDHSRLKYVESIIWPEVPALAECCGVVGSVYYLTGVRTRSGEKSITC